MSTPHHMATSSVRRPGHPYASRPVPRQRRDPRQRYRGLVYGIPTLPVDQHGRVIPGAAPVLGYVGKSRQTVWQREQQHRADQPFGDLICGGSWVIEEGVWTEEELDAREQHYIRCGVVLVPGQRPQRPVYNHDHNLGNPERIEIWRARQHRQVREPGWQPPPKGARVVVQPTARRRWWPSVRWTRSRIRMVALAVLWTALAAAFWAAGWDVWHGWDGPRNAAIAAAIVQASGSVALAYARRPRRRARRRRR